MEKNEPKVTLYDYSFQKTTSEIEESMLRVWKKLQERIRNEYGDELPDLISDDK